MTVPSVAIFSPGADHEHVPGDERVGGQGDLGALAVDGAQHAGLLRAEAQEGFQGVAGALLRGRLEEAAQQEEGDDDGGHLEVEGVLRHVHAGHPGVLRQGRIGDELPGREQERGRDADGDERVHGGGEVAGVDGRRAVERPCGPRHHRQGQREDHPAPVRELEARHHGDQQHRYGQDGGEDQARAEERRRVVVPVPVRVVGMHHVRAVAGGHDGVDQVLVADGGRHADHGALQRQVDARLDAVELAELPLDPPDARRARHALDGEFDDAVLLFGALGRGLPGGHVRIRRATTV